MLLKKHDFSDDALDSVLLLSNGVVHRKSRAALRIARKLDGAWPVFFYLFHWLPALVADPVYDFIGNRRYKWFGMKNVCWIPDAELQQRFIGD
jgi:predicted DCC family thiol-disulfide oxidoreductase YuxK